jgi:hypothetical protein
MHSDVGTIVKIGRESERLAEADVLCERLADAVDAVDADADELD